MSLRRKTRSTASTPNKFQSVILGASMNHHKQLQSIKSNHIGSLKQEEENYPKFRPLPYEHKSKSLDSKLAAFFHKKGRPRPTTIVPKTIEQLLQKQIYFPKIKSKRQREVSKTLESMGIDEDKALTSQLHEVSKTIPTQCSTIQNSKKILNKKQYRKFSIISSKKSIVKEEMFTKQGWANDMNNKDQWLFNTTKMFE